MSIIECRQLTRTYRKGENMITPLKELDLDIEAGAFLALMGPSGSGKTTLLNLLAGIDRPTSGSLTIDGLDIARLSRDALAAWRSLAVGYIFQLYNLMPVLTAYENVELPLLLQKLPGGSGTSASRRRSNSSGSPTGTITTPASSAADRSSGSRSRGPS